MSKQRVWFGSKPRHEVLRAFLRDRPSPTPAHKAISRRPVPRRPSPRAAGEHLTRALADVNKAVAKVRRVSRAERPAPVAETGTVQHVLRHAVRRVPSVRLNEDSRESVRGGLARAFDREKAAYTDGSGQYGKPLPLAEPAPTPAPAHREVASAHSQQVSPPERSVGRTFAHALNDLRRKGRFA